MAVNQYLNQYRANADQNLIESLIIEAIKCTGLDVHFIPRNVEPKDDLFDEVPTATFTKSYEIEMYFKNAMGWEGRNDFLSKFGLQIEEQGKLTVSMKRFREITGMQRPFEGDLIYLPLTKSLYQITFVEHETIMHQVGKLQVWDLDIDLFNYSNQKIRTGNDFIDIFENVYAHALLFTMATGTGRYKKNEWAYQGTSLATATAKGIVLSYDTTTRELKLKDISGQFDPALLIVGDTSGVSGTVQQHISQELPNSPNAENEVLERYDNVLDWSEKNPFGET